MINSFKTYLVEEEKTLYFVWGRMNPPTAGHEKLLDFLKSKAGRNPFRIYLTQSTDNKKNPIPFVDKVKFARKGFPQYARQIMLNKKLKTIFDAMTSFYDEGFKRITIVAGSDRVTEYDITLNKYNGKKGRHGFYNFEKITVLSAGNRDPESKGVEGVSGTKLRGYAESGDFTQFMQYMPKKLSNSDAKRVFNAVRKGLGLKEEKQFKNHVQLKPVSETREAYISGELFSVGDSVVIKETSQVATIDQLGSNYVIVEANGMRFRKWLDDVELLEKVDHEKTAQRRIDREKQFDKGRHDKMLAKARIRDVMQKNRKDKMGEQTTTNSQGVTTTVNKAANRVTTQSDAGTTVKDRSGRMRSYTTPKIGGFQATQTYRPDSTPGYRQATYQRGPTTLDIKGSPETGFTKSASFNMAGGKVKQTNRYSGQKSTSATYNMGDVTKSYRKNS
jgi:hypothetical protein